MAVITDRRISVFSFLLAMVSLIFAVYAFWITRIEGEMSFSEFHEPVFLNVSGFDVRATFGAITISEKNIYEHKIVVWNGGNVPIRDQDVREKYRVVFGGEEILGVHVKETHPEYAKVDLNSDGVIAFRNFDPGSFIKARVLAAADDHPKGVAILGYTPNIDVSGNYCDIPKSPVYKAASLFSFVISLGSLFLFMSILYNIILKKMPKLERRFASPIWLLPAIIIALPLFLYLALQTMILVQLLAFGYQAGTKENPMEFSISRYHPYAVCKSPWVERMYESG